jgi:hypothetical protein
VLKKKTALISGFRRDVDEIRALLVFYAASCGNLTTRRSVMYQKSTDFTKTAVKLRWAPLKTYTIKHSGVTSCIPTNVSDEPASLRYILKDIFISMHFIDEDDA